MAKEKTGQKIVYFRIPRYKISVFMERLWVLYFLVNTSVLLFKTNGTD